MTNLVPPKQIEEFVGAKRHPDLHIGRMVTETRTVYIMHSHECVERFKDLRRCPFSLALDEGVDEERWIYNMPVVLRIVEGRLLPLRAYRPEGLRDG